MNVLGAASESCTAPVPLSVQTRAWRQQQIERLTACALRAETGDARLGFRGRHGWRGAEPMAWLAPHLRTEPWHGLSSYRAVADALALRQLRSDAAIHLAHAPPQELPRMLYEWFEQLRCEALVPAAWQGARGNLQAHFTRWTLAFHDSALMETQLGQLLFAVSQLVWSRLQQQPPPEEVLDTMEATRANLAPLLGRDILTMGRQRERQALFAPAAASLAHVVADLVLAEQARAAAYPANRKARAGAGFFLWLDGSPNETASLLLAPSGDSRGFAAGGKGYAVFTRAFDRQLQPATRVRPALLADYRRRLDQRLHELHPPVGRLGRQLAALLAVPEQSDWHFEQEEGRIDGRQLPRVVTSPHERRVFRREAERDHSDCVLTLLLDCSGSMKAHAETLALLAEIWARMAHQAQTPFEVLGFSTASWQGGQARQAWQRAGRPALAGRVAERLHLVYKSAGESWQRSRLALASLLKLDLYREGLDGEAVLWACERLRRQHARRRILLVVSDGCPMESATQQANDAFYLDNHLKAVVRQQMNLGVEIIGIGLGLDLSPFYPVHLPLEPDKVLHTASLQAMLRLIAYRSAWDAHNGR